jgi:hypothetical protein
MNAGDVRRGAAASRGLLDRRGGRADTYDRRDRDWLLMTAVGVHPIMSIVWLRTILDYPPEAMFRPIDLSDPEKLQRVHGVSYGSYREIPGPAHRSN